jgi:uncharacterized protein (UPF0332 family)
MKESFLLRAKENIEASELLFDIGKYNASANRAYYAAFHAAIAAIYSIGIEPNIDHKVIQSLFADNFCNRRKIVPSKYKGYLKDMQHIRSNADYRSGASKKDAKEQLKFAKEFVELILSIIV